MKYRSKLYVAFVTTAVGCSLLATGIVYQETKQLFYKEFQSKILSIAATTASLINGDLLKQIETQNDENGVAYRKVQHQLRKARDANIRDEESLDGIRVSYIYTLRPVEKDDHNMEFVVDSADQNANRSHIGEVYSAINHLKLPEKLDRYFSPKGFIHDPRGIFMVGFAPIYDSAGQYVGTIGVDINSHDINMEIDRLLLYGLWAILAAVVLSTLIAFFLSRIITKSLNLLCETVHKVEEGDLKTEAKTGTHDEFEEMGNALNSMIKGLRERELISASFAKYVSPELMKKVLSSQKIPIRGGGSRREITILFADIRQFTTLSEKLPSEEVIDILNELFTEFSAAIFNNNGAIDKFIGDGVMAVYNAFIDDPNHCENGLKTALEMKKRLSKLNEKWREEGKPELSLGIGVHTGEAIVGNVGSEERMEFTCIGDTVNVASRVEELTKEHHVPIIASDKTVKNVADQYSLKNLGKITIRGRQNTLTLYSVEGEKK